MLCYVPIQREKWTVDHQGNGHFVKEPKDKIFLLTFLLKPYIMSTIASNSAEMHSSSPHVHFIKKAERHHEDAILAPTAGSTSALVCRSCDGSRIGHGRRCDEGQPDGHRRRRGAGPAVSLESAGNLPARRHDLRPER